jgi:hypothetical protein
MNTYISIEVRLEIIAHIGTEHGIVHGNRELIRLCQGG